MIAPTTGRERISIGPMPTIKSQNKARLASRRRGGIRSVDPGAQIGPFTSVTCGGYLRCLGLSSMPLRCLLFCADPEAASLLVRVLAELRIDAEHCPSSVTATERVTSRRSDCNTRLGRPAGCGTASGRSAHAESRRERPLTLAIVGDDGGVPKALQAGANSILRKPLLAGQVRDTLTTAQQFIAGKAE